MNKKQKEALVIALAEKGETYREFTKKAGVSPNTIKAVLNRAGVELLKIANGHLPRVRLEYDRLKAELNSLEDEKSNSTEDYHQLCNEISEMKTTRDQLQLTIKESKEEKAKLELQKIKLENFLKDFQDNNIEYNKVKQAIQEEVEYILTDRRRLLRTAIQSVIELLRLDPQKFHSYYYNQSTTIQPENGKEPLLVEAERLYEKMLENITNKVITSPSDNISSTSPSAQKELSEQNSDDMRASSDYLCAKKECTLSEPEDKEIQRNLFKERPDVPAGHRMLYYPYSGQAWHPNFDAEV